MAKLTFVCEECGDECVSDWDDEEAQAEALKQFGKRGDDPSMVVICDDCYQKIMRRVRAAEIIVAVLQSD